MNFIYKELINLSHVFCKRHFYQKPDGVYYIIKLARAVWTAIMQCLLGQTRINLYRQQTDGNILGGCQVICAAA